MSSVTVYSFAAINPSVIVSIGKRLGYSVEINEESTGYFRVNTTPDLSAQHKIIVLQLIDRIGYGVVTP